MQLMEECEIEYPRIVRVARPETADGDAGSPVVTERTVIAEMAADIQLSLRVRTLVSEDETGADDNAVWVMYCVPPSAVLPGDRVYDGERVFAVESAADWGSHTECVMRER